MVEPAWPGHVAARNWGLSAFKSNISSLRQPVNEGGIKWRLLTLMSMQMPIFFLLLFYAWMPILYTLYAIYG